MSENIKERKQMLREQALRARSMMAYPSKADIQSFQDFFLNNIPLDENSIIAGYWAKDREFDVSYLLEELTGQGYQCALPLVDGSNKVLKFVEWTPQAEMQQGRYGISHPLITENTHYLQPTILVVPLLVFDRKGYRLGFGGGYYDATIEALEEKGSITTVGAAYAEQASLFNLPIEVHDKKLDWVITPQQAIKF